MLTRADTALFAAKNTGRDRITVHNPHGHEKLYPATAFAGKTAAVDAKLVAPPVGSPNDQPA